MMDDPAIDEIRKVRHKISKRFGHDPKRLIDHLLERQKKHAKRLYHSDISQEKVGLSSKVKTSPDLSK